MDKPVRVPLDGIWEFFYSPQKFDENAPLPERTAFSGRMVTPGYWDDHLELFDEEDFFSLRARFNPDYRKPHFPMGTTLLPHASSCFLIGTGFYRKQVKLETSPGARIFLTVGPAMWGCAVFCNGSFAGKVTGYSVSTEFDITPFARGGELNEIVIAVCNVHDDGGAFCRLDGSHDGIPFGARPGQHRGLAAQGYQSERAGIGDHTFLRITGPGAVSDAWITFEDGRPHWHAELVNGAGTRLLWSLKDGGKLLDSGTFSCSGDTADFFSDDAGLPRWSDREPRLLTARLELVTDDGSVSDVWTRPWGARKVECRGNRIAVNGGITFFRGATEHCYFAETCNPHFDREKYLHDLGVLKKAGFNFIRCHTWCPPEQFYSACDELGIFVQTELPSVYSFDEAEAIIRHIRRHPCAVIFCEGNEKRINDEVLARMKKLVSMLRAMAPGMLFNPQEAMRVVEYDFDPSRPLAQKPVRHDAARLADVAAFSDVYGSLGFGYFSYHHDMFPGPEQTDCEHSHYKKPCLSHEIGILGGYLDFDLEPRYEGTYIGTDLFAAAREHMRKRGVWQNRKRYFLNNCRFISSLRKQLIENLRSCSNITGYDYLGGIDTHWHLIGYPCGIFNEFYEEKPGETAEDVRRYNGESILLCSALRHRNFRAGASFDEKLLLSFFGRGPGNIRGRWRFENAAGEPLAEGGFSRAETAPGTVSPLCGLAFTLPGSSRGERCVLRAEALLDGEEVENFWYFWVFPAPQVSSGTCRIVEKLSPADVDFASSGGTVLLTGNFPAESPEETFRPHTSGRCFGHAGALINPHPVWRDFPCEEFMDWQFCPMMTQSHSIVYDDAMPEFRPAMELIPSFKLVKHKSMLSEFQVGSGRIVMCGLNFAADDPAGAFLEGEILAYLEAGDFVPAPAWDPGDLKKRLAAGPFTSRRPVAVDAGGRPLDM